MKPERHRCRCGLVRAGPDLCDDCAAQRVTHSRRAQGLPGRVTDPATLEHVGAILAEPLETALEVAS